MDSFGLDVPARIRMPDRKDSSRVGVGYSGECRIGDDSNDARVGESVAMAVDDDDGDSRRNLDEINDLKEKWGFLLDEIDG